MEQDHKVTVSSSLSFSHPGFSRNDFSGPVYDLIQRELSLCLEYQLIRAGQISPSKYVHFLEGAHEQPFAAGLTENQRHLVARFPQSEEAFVDQALKRLHQAGVIDTVEYPKDSFVQFRERVRLTFDHGGYITFIFPEEERLVFALSHILRPKNALFLGSYYGYWGVWMLPAVLQAGGHATFIDPNPHTNSVARENLASLGFAVCTKVIDAEGTQFLREYGQERSFDFLLLDAEGPDDAPDTNFRGKQVYLPLITAALPYMCDKATVVTHNILLRNDFVSAYFDRLIEKNVKELQGFVDFTSRHFSSVEVIDSTEGIGIYKV